MKQNYVKPRTIEVECSTFIMAGSQVEEEQWFGFLNDEGRPPMGRDSKACRYTDFD